MQAIHHSLRDICNWKAIVAQNNVINWIEQDVKTPFKSALPTCVHANMQFSVTEAKFVDSEIHSLLDSGAIRQVDYVPQCTSGLNVVPKKGDKLCLVIDMRSLNVHVDTPYFKNETIDIVSQFTEYRPNCVKVTTRSRPFAFRCTYNCKFTHFTYISKRFQGGNNYINPPFKIFLKSWTK